MKKYIKRKKKEGKEKNQILIMKKNKKEWEEN